LLHCTSQNWGESLPGFRFLVACVSKSKDREPPFFPYIGLMIADKSQQFAIITSSSFSCQGVMD